MLISTLAGWRSRERWDNRKTHHDGMCEPVLRGDVDLDVDRNACTVGMTEDSHGVELRRIGLVGSWWDLSVGRFVVFALFLQSNLICLATAPLAARVWVRRDLKDNHPFTTGLETLPYMIPAVL